MDGDVLKTRDRIGEFPKLWPTHTFEIIIIPDPSILPFSNKSSDSVKKDDGWTSAYLGSRESVSSPFKHKT